MIESFVGCDGF